MRKLIKHAKHGFKHKPYHMSFLGVLLFGSFLLLGIGAHTIKSYADGTPPVNLGAPSLSGTTAVGQVMTVSDGNWTGAPTFTYQWRSCDSAGANCADITGATNNTYTLQSSDGGNTVKAVVTAHDIDEFTSHDSDTSAVIQAQLGDLNSDGIINIFDLGILLGQYGSQAGGITDLDSNGIVNDADITMILGLYQP